MTDRELFEAVNDLVERYVKYPPVDVVRLCQALGARMITFSQAVDAGMDPHALVECLGNKDGVALEGAHSWAIVYNKNAPLNRLRFTLAEELMHHVLGHTKDQSFVWHSQSYSDQTYLRYEHEAKRAASLLLIPPSVYYKYQSWYDTHKIALLCGVSDACMGRAAAWYDSADRELIELMYTTKNLSPHGLMRGYKIKNPMHPVSIWPSNGML